MSKRLELEKDYILDQYSVQCTNNSNITWICKKWNSGISEVYGQYTIIPTETAGWSAWGSLYEFGPFGPFNFPDGIFIDTPIFFSSGFGIQSIVSIENSTPCTSTSTPTFYLLRPNTGYANAVWCNFMAIGKWK